MSVSSKNKPLQLMLRLSILLIILLLGILVLLGYFKRSRPVQALPAQKPDSAVLVTKALDPEVLMPGSRWRGVLRISNHKGKGFLKNGTYAVYGLIDRNDEGSYFELYEEDDPDGFSPLLTMYVTLDYNTLIPRIGTENARYFYIWLDERDVSSLTMKLSNSTLTSSYFYDDGAESCQIDFSIKQEK